MNYTQRQVKAIIDNWADCGNDFKALKTLLDDRDLQGYKFPYKSDLSGMSVIYSALDDVDFNEAILDNADFTAARLYGCSFENTHWGEATIFNAQFDNCYFENAHMYGVNINDKTMINSNCCDIPEWIKDGLCDECHYYVGEGALRKMNDTGRNLCDACRREFAFCCEHCEEWYEYSETDYENDDGITLCCECFYDHYNRCQDCGCIVHDDNAYWDDSGDHCYCETCWNDRSDKYILDYHDYWERKFQGDDEGLYLGFECEAGDTTHSKMLECAEEIHNPDHHVMMKDGSIDSYGFELISHPWSLNKHIEDGWDVLETMVRYGMRSHDANSCGLHVHASRDFMSFDAWKELGFFVNKYKGFFSKLSRRCDNKYAKFVDVYEDDKVSSIAAVCEHLGRYHAVNYRNANTIEFRLFKGTLRKSTLFATLELVHALCFFFREFDNLGIDSDYYNPKLQEFKDFLKSNKYHEYKYINDYIVERGAQDINN